MYCITDRRDHMGGLPAMVGFNVTVIQMKGYRVRGRPSTSRLESGDKLEYSILLKKVNGTVQCPRYPCRNIYPSKLHIKPCFCIAIPDRIHSTPANISHHRHHRPKQRIPPFSIATQAHVQDTARNPLTPFHRSLLRTTTPRNTNTTFPPPALHHATSLHPLHPVPSAYIHIPVRPER